MWPLASGYTLLCIAVWHLGGQLILGFPSGVWIEISVDGHWHLDVFPSVVINYLGLYFHGWSSNIWSCVSYRWSPVAVAPHWVSLPRSLVQIACNFPLYVAAVKLPLLFYCPRFHSQKLPDIKSNPSSVWLLFKVFDKSNLILQSLYLSVIKTAQSFKYVSQDKIMAFSYSGDAYTDPF